MSEKNQMRAGKTVQESPAVPAGNEVSLDHGAQSLVAQDSPDDSELGGPEMKEEPLIIQPG